MRGLGGVVVLVGVVNAVGLAVVFVSKLRSGSAYAYFVMAALLLAAVLGVQLGRIMMRPRPHHLPVEP